LKTQKRIWKQEYD